MATGKLRCGLGTHELVGDGVKITDPRFIKLVKLYNNEYRANWLVCEECVGRVKRIYHYKLKRKLAQNRSLTEISSVQNSSHDSQDSIDRLVLLTPRNPNLTNHSKLTTNTSYSSDSSDNSRTKQEQPVRIFPISSGSELTNSEENAVPKETGPPIVTPQQKSILSANKRKTTADPQSRGKVRFDDEYVPSPNVTNGTRLPHVQPIVKRRKMSKTDSFDFGAYYNTADIHGG